MVDVVSKPSVAFSKRSLLTNYYISINEDKKNSLDITERATGDSYKVVEDNNGTSFFLNKITNGTSVIRDLYECGVKYIIFREYGIDGELFQELVSDTKKYIKGNCLDDTYVDKYKKLGESTNFFFKKTIYKVKKNG